MKEIPKHIEYMIKHEKRCIELRLKQIEGCKARIKILESGTGYFESLKIIKPIYAHIKFSKEEYFKLGGKR